MATIINLDVMMARRKLSATELAERIGITLTNLSILKTGKAKAIRFSTLNAICWIASLQIFLSIDWNRESGVNNYP